jgi:hypothetical protein
LGCQAALSDWIAGKKGQEKYSGEGLIILAFRVTALVFNTRL